MANIDNYVMQAKWGTQFKAVSKFPLEANRIFKTMSELEAYLADSTASASAIPGLILSVIEDNVNPEENNGLWEVYGTDGNLLIRKLGTGKFVPSTIEPTLENFIPGETYKNEEAFLHLANLTEGLKVDISTKISDLSTYIDSSFATKQELIDTEYVLSKAINILEIEKLDNLVSGVNIKTINNESILGEGNLEIILDSSAIIDSSTTKIQFSEIFYPESNLENFVYINTNNSKLYKAKKIDNFELDFSKFTGTTITGQQIKDKLNENGHLFLGDIENYEYQLINNVGLVLDSSDILSFAKLVFSLDNYLKFPRVFIEKADITIKAYYNQDNLFEQDLYIIEVNAHDNKNTAGWIRRAVRTTPGSIPPSVNFIVTRTLQHDVEIEGETVTEDINLLPINCIDFHKYNGDGRRVIIEKIKFYFTSANSEKEYNDEIYNKALYLKSITKEDIDNTTIGQPTENNVHKFYRTENQDVNFTNCEETTNGYVLVLNLEDLIDGEYLIVSSSAESIMSNETGVDAGSNAHIDRINKVIIPDSEYNAKYYESREFNVLIDDNNHIHLFSKAAKKYIGFTGAKNGINTSDQDDYTNTLSFDSGNIIITCQGSGASTLQYYDVTNIFRFYKSALKPIQFYKKIAGNPYTWDKLVKHSEIKKVALTSDYNDLINTPTYTIGDVQIYDVSTLPEPTSAYKKKLLRLNDTIYTLSKGAGVDVDILKFVNQYPNIQAGNAATQLNEYFKVLLSERSNYVVQGIFTQSTKLATTTTNTRGIQIGSLSSIGKLLWIFTSCGYGSYYTFDKISLTLELYANEDEHIYIKTFNNDAESTTTEVNFTYIEGSETLQTKDIEISFANATSLSIQTDIPEGTSTRGRTVITKLILHNFKFNHGTAPDEDMTFYANNMWKAIAGNGIISINYIDLKELRDNSKLIQGLQYRIIDYVCTTSTIDTSSAEHQFDIIVTANDKNILNENARAIQHEGDIYFVNCKLENWELKYCLDNDSSRFIWADNVNGKGVIYYMKDEWNNKCPYDFKNILFKRYCTISNSVYEGFEYYAGDGYYYYSDDMRGEWPERKPSPMSVHVPRRRAVKVLADTLCDKYVGYRQASTSNRLPGGLQTDNEDYKWLYTFAVYKFNENFIEDETVLPRTNTIKVHNNCIKAYFNTNNLQVLNNVTMYTKYDTYNSCKHFNNSLNNCYNISFLSGCNNITLGTDNNDIIFGENNRNIIFGNDCSNNAFGNNCINITAGNILCYTILSGSKPNSEDGGSYSITFGNNCYIEAGYNFTYGAFGNESNIQIGDDCDNITMGGDSDDIRIGDNCSNIFLGNEVNCIRMGHNMDTIIFENSVESISFLHNSSLRQDEATGSNYTDIKFGIGCSGIDIYDEIEFPEGYHKIRNLFFDNVTSRYVGINPIVITEYDQNYKTTYINNNSKLIALD